MRNFNTTPLFGRSGLLIALGIVALWQLFAYLDIFEKMYLISRVYESSEIDELIIVLLVSLIVFSIAILLKDRRASKSKPDICCDSLNKEIPGQYKKSEYDYILSNWLLEVSEADQLIKSFGTVRKKEGFNEEEIDILLNWANSIRCSEKILDLINKEKINVDVIDKKIKILSNY